MDKWVPTAAATLTNVQQLSANGNSTLALLNDGSLLAWGLNNYGQLGDKTVTNRTRWVRVIGATYPKPSVAASYYDSYALQADGTLRAWGDNTVGSVGGGAMGSYATKPQTVSVPKVISVSAGGQHALTLLSDGTVKAWGWNGNGQLGDGTQVDKPGPVAVPGLANVVAVSAGGYHSLALLSDGTIKAWGYNSMGQLGDGSTTMRLAPVAVSGITNAVAVAAGRWHSMALLADGTVRAWGYNFYGAVGNNTTTTNFTTPQTVTGITNAVVISAGGSGINATGEGDNSYALLADGTIKAWGRNNYGQLGDGTSTDRIAPVTVAGISGVTAISAGAFHASALKTDGTVWSWGLGNSGRLGNGSVVNSWSPVQAVGVTQAVGVAAGGTHTVALMSDGTMRAWGANSYGQLGDLSTTSRSSSVPVAGYGQWKYWINVVQALSCLLCNGSAETINATCQVTMPMTCPAGSRVTIASGATLQIKANVDFPFATDWIKVDPGGNLVVDSGSMIY